MFALIALVLGADFAGRTAILGTISLTRVILRGLGLLTCFTARKMICWIEGPPRLDTTKVNDKNASSVSSCRCVGCAAV